MNSFPLIDLHQDLQSHLDNLDLFPRGKQTDFSLLERAHTKLVVATAFPLPPKDNFFDPVTDTLIENDFRAYLRHVATHPNWRIVRNADDLRDVLTTQNARGILMHIEGLNLMSENGFDKLEHWYALGWRSLGIVWNLTNALGGGTQDPTTGLSPLGERVIDWLQEKRMVVDFAHMNRPTFWDAAKRVKGPLYISHGNACARCPSPRNYDNDQLRAVAKSGGVVGVMFANTYVVGKGNPGTVADVANHVDHFVQVMGIDHVALGTDFGGIVTGLVKGLESLDRLPALWEELSRRGYADADLEKIAWRNAARVLLEIL